MAHPAVPRWPDPDGSRPGVIRPRALRDRIRERSRIEGSSHDLRHHAANDHGHRHLIVKLAAKPPFRNGELQLPRGAERKTAIWDGLVQTAATSQVPLIALAEELKAAGEILGYETLVSPNAIIIDPSNTAGGAKALARFSAAAGVRAIYDQKGDVKFGGAGLADAHDGAHELGRAPHTGLDVHTRDEPVANLSGEPLPWGLAMVGAPEANAVGADGTGLVYGSIDTGADFTHEAIAARYRGLQADGSVSHERSWFDFGPTRSATPKDPDAHGTHTIGTVLGSTPELQIGVAPKASWISVAGLKGGLDVRLKALQFMQAPTNLDGTSPDPAAAPDVVGMSWWTGPGSSDAFRESLDNLTNAGIETVKSAGNKGDGPETISAPGQFPIVNAIAAVDSNADIAKFSSRGPSPLPHTGKSPEWKPDFAAPGVDVLSSVPGNKYAKYSGTSMAQPHFSGVVLALLTKYPKLTHAQLNQVLAASSRDVGAKGRDLEFGHGIVNIPAALAVAAAKFPDAAA
ncbi:MAG: peptidase [Thermoleophilia bacterium]|nr:peptidase [Thermoleophilia bacterium]